MDVHVPSALAALPNWLTWAYATRKGKLTKIPYAADGSEGSSTNPKTWCSYREAVASGRCPGFVFQKHLGIVGIDIDGAIAEDDKGRVPSEWAKEIADKFSKTYVELSPSKTGFKIFCLGKLPEGIKHDVDVPGAVQVCKKSPGIEAYEDARYFCFTGNKYEFASTELSNCQDEIDWLYEKYFKRFEREPRRTVSFDVEAIHVGSSEKERRARKYLFQIDPPDPREENPMDASLRLYRGACILIRFDITGQLALNILAEWDANNPAGPYPRSELERTLSNASKDAIHGEFLGKSDYEIDVNIDEIINGHSVFSGESFHQGTALSVPSLPRPSVPKKDQDRPGIPIPKECLEVPGIIGELIDYTLSISPRKRPILALGGAISIMGTLLGRRVQDESGMTPNVYVIGVCKTGGGKESARKVIKRVFSKRDERLRKLMGPESIASGPGITTVLKKRPVVLFPLDEVGKFLKTILRENAGSAIEKISKFLLTLFSTGQEEFLGDAYADEDKTADIEYPQVNIYGTTVPENFWKSLKPEHIADGLVSRFMIFNAPGDARKRRIKDTPLPESIFEKVLKIASFNPEKITTINLVDHVAPDPRIIAYTKEAEDRYDLHEQEIEIKSEAEELVTQAIWSRVAEKTRKLAMIFACSRANGEIPSHVELCDMNLAIKLSNWLARSVIQNVSEEVSENLVEENLKRVLKIIRKICGENGVMQSELTLKTQWLTKKQRDEILINLLNSGQIITKPGEGGARGTKGTVIMLPEYSST